MSENSSERRFPWGKILLLFIVGIVLRVNLPPASVSGALDLSALEKENCFLRAAVGTTAKIMVTDAVAGWQYRDFVIFRVATSKRFNATAIGLPFCNWNIYGNEQNEKP